MDKKHTASKPQSPNSMFCSHVLSIVGRHALYDQIKVMNLWAWGFGGVCILTSNSLNKFYEQLESFWKTWGVSCV